MDNLTSLFDRLVALRNEGRISRRQFAKLTGGGVGAATITAFLTACGAEPTVPTAGTGGGTGSDTTPTTQPDPTGTAAGTTEPTTTPTEASGEPVQGGKLVFALDTAPLGFDPHLTVADSSLSFYEHIYDSLFEFSPTLALVPSLAESFDVIDETTYRFAIRQGVTFHDGQPLTAEDVKFSYDRMLDPEVKSVRQPWFSEIDGVEVTDSHTVIVHLKNPFAPLLSYMGMAGAAIVSKAFTEAHDNDLSQVTNGTGPFSLREYQTNQFGALVRNPNHWRGGVPLVDELELRIVTDESSRVAAIRAKEADMTRVYEQQNSEILAQEGYQVYKGLSTARAMTYINTRKAPFDDPRVRQALSFAIDRQEFIDTALFGDGKPTGDIPVADETWALPTTEFATYTQDVERARALLAEAGYPDGFTARITVSPQYAFDVANAQVLQNQLKAVGITLEIQQVEWGQLIDTLVNTRDFDLINVINTHQPDPDGYTYGNYHHSSPLNPSGLADPALDELLERGRATADPAERKAIYDQVQHKLHEELVPSLIYYSYYQYLPAQTYVHGFQTVPSLSRIYLRETWLEK